MRSLMLAAAFLAIGASASEASFYARCAIEVEVVSANDGNVKFRVDALLFLGGHGPCPVSVGDYRTAPVEDVGPETGRRRLSLHYLDTLTPSGVVVPYAWQSPESGRLCGACRDLFVAALARPRCPDDRDSRLRPRLSGGFCAAAAGMFATIARTGKAPGKGADEDAGD